MSSEAKNPLPPLKDWIHQISFLTSAARSADLPALGAVSYTHLTLPTNREV